MDKKAFQKSLREMQGIPCAFAKILLARRCECECAERFAIAEREGIRCASRLAQSDCVSLLTVLHEQARFALGMTEVPASLPHSKELKIQGGGLEGLKQVVHGSAQTPGVENVHSLVSLVEKQFGGFNALPTEEIIRAIATYQVRRPRQSR